MLQPNSNKLHGLTDQSLHPRQQPPLIGALWLVPDLRSTDSLQRVLAECPSAHGLTFFQPHITVKSGQTVSVPSDEHMQDFAGQLKGPFALRVQRIGYESSFFRTVYLECLLDAEQQASIAKVTAQQELAGTKPFAPQLKFAGGRLEESEKELLTRSLSAAVETITFDRLVFASVPNDEIAWDQIDRWQMTSPTNL